MLGLPHFKRYYYAGGVCPTLIQAVTTLWQDHTSTYLFSRECRSCRIRFTRVGNRHIAGVRIVITYVSTCTGDSDSASRCWSDMVAVVESSRQSNPVQPWAPGTSSLANLQLNKSCCWIYILAPAKEVCSIMFWRICHFVIRQCGLELVACMQDSTSTAPNKRWCKWELFWWMGLNCRWSRHLNMGQVVGQ